MFRKICFVSSDICKENRRKYSNKMKLICFLYLAKAKMLGLDIVNDFLEKLELSICLTIFEVQIWLVMGQYLFSYPLTVVLPVCFVPKVDKSLMLYL